jgi:aminopeptidase N
MRKSVFLILVCFSWLIPVFAQEPDPYFTDKAALQESLQFRLKSAFQEFQDYSNYDLIYQRMEWKIDPAVKYISGKVTSYFKSETENLAEIGFDLDSLMTIDSVFYQNQKVQIKRNGDRFFIQFENSVSSGQIDSVSVFYQGEPEKQQTGFGAFGMGIHDGFPVMWTLSEPYGALEWWPCKQSLVDKIDSIDVIVTTPEIYRTASNGVVVENVVEAGSRKMHWKHRHPIATYLVAIAVTNYATYSDWLELEDGRKIEILNYVYPEKLEQAKLETPITADLIALYNQIIGEYPFANEKYGHAQFGWGGGMEHQTMSFMYNFNFELVAHELAHQWFGDYITCGSWQHIWLNEGFATYLSGLAYENLKPEWWYRFRKLNVERIVSQPGGSVFVKDTTNESVIFSSRLSYSKGAWLLHMLRWELGDEKFFNGLRSYFNDPAVANGFATTSQFVKHMETAGDTTLTEFFNDWFYGEGYPIYSAGYKNIGDGYYQISLSQTTSHPSVSFFEMPVPVRFYSKGKTDSVDFRLVHTQNDQEFLVKVDFPVASMMIDPEYWLVSKTSKVTGTPLVKNITEFYVYPNPVQNKFSVVLPIGQQFRSIRIYSSAGQFKKEFLTHEIYFDVSDLASGIYFLQLETVNGIIDKKIVKK